MHAARCFFRAAPVSYCRYELETGAARKKQRARSAAPLSRSGLFGTRSRPPRVESSALVWHALVVRHVKFSSGDPGVVPRNSCSPDLPRLLSGFVLVAISLLQVHSRVCLVFPVNRTSRWPSYVS